MHPPPRYDTRHVDPPKVCRPAKISRAKTEPLSVLFNCHQIKRLYGHYTIAVTARDRAENLDDAERC